MELLILYFKTAVITTVIYLSMDHVVRFAAKKFYFHHLALMYDTIRWNHLKRGPDYRLSRHYSFAVLRDLLS
jgi:hypothetical protein